MQPWILEVAVMNVTAMYLKCFASSYQAGEGLTLTVPRLLDGNS